MLALREIESEYIVIRRHLVRFDSLLRKRLSIYYYTTEGFLVVKPSVLTTFLDKPLFLHPSEQELYNDFRNIIVKYYKPLDTPF